MKVRVFADALPCNGYARAVGMSLSPPAGGTLVLSAEQFAAVVGRPAVRGEELELTLAPAGEGETGKD